MNYWQDEKTAEYNRQRIVEEIQQIRLERAALKSCVYHPGLFTSTMFNFANWMISTGKSLRKRYEVPSTNRNQAPSKSFAQ